MVATVDTVQRLREILVDHDMTVVEFTGRTGISAATLSAARARHTQLTIGTIEKVCQYFNMPLFEFFMSDQDWADLDGYYRRMIDGKASTSIA